MKQITSLLVLAIGVTSALNDTEQFVADFSPIAASGYYTTLLKAITDTGSDKVISSNAPVTIFGPSDDAFFNISNEMEIISNDELASILLNHVIVDANVTTASLAELGCIEAKTAGGLDISIFRDPFTGDVDIDGWYYVVDPDIFFNGGVMHGIDNVILSEFHEFFPCPETVDFFPIGSLGNYSTFLGALGQTNNDFTITVNAINTTIFGPSNAALAAIKDTLDGLTTEQLSDVLWGHMAFGEMLSTEVIASKCVELETFSGTNLAVRFNETAGTASVNGIPISTTVCDILGDRYVFHAIEGLLIEAEYVPCSEDPLDFSPVVAAGKYSTLLDLVGRQAGLVEEIDVLRPVTILAPTNDAFSRVQDTLSGLNETEIEDSLASHIITNETLDSLYMETAECLEYFTLGGSMVSIRHDIATGKTSVNGIPVIELDIFGNYGVLIGLDGVLGIDGEYVPCNPFLEFELISQIYEDEIVEAAVKARVSSATAFGPSDDALYALDGYPYYDDPQKEIDLLLGHIVPGLYTAAQVKEAGCIVLDTFAGTKVRVMWMEGDQQQNVMTGRGSHMGGKLKAMVMVNDAKVIFSDQFDEGTGSIFHGIDRVILPGSFSECPSKPTMAPVAAPIVPPTAPPASSAFRNCLGVVFASMFALVALFQP